MLQLLLGRDWVASRNEILRLAAEDVSQKLPNRIIMVPELISHDMERRLCSAAGDTASRYAEVLSFTRLARRVSEGCGSGGMQCLDNGGRVVAMAAAARQLHSKLKAYAAVETRPEFLTGLVEAVDEFKRCCISPADLLSASRCCEGSFAQKLEELSLLLETYDSICQRGKRDPRDQMNWLLEQLEDSDFAENHVFYIDGFPDFTRQHMAILTHLIRNSPIVTVSLTCDRLDTAELSFEKASATARELLLAAKQQDVPVQIRYVDEEPSDLWNVRARLFQGKITPAPQLVEKLFMLHAETEYLECMGAAQRVLELVQGGCRYRDIGIVCTDIAVYRDMLDLVLKRCDIPVYLTGTEDILQKTVITSLLNALDAVQSGFEQKSVLRYLKSVLSPLSMDRCDSLENYVILWGISGRRWHEPWKNHPMGLGESWNSYDEEALSALNTSRELALTPLLHLEQGFRKAGKLSQQVEALYAFLEEIRLAQRLRQLAVQMDEKDDNRTAQILNQLWEIILQAMEQMHDVLGDTVWDTEVFTRLFTLLLSQYDVGTIPPVLDAVSIGTVSSMRCQEMKHMILLGAKEGALPGYGGSNGVLTDQERVALRELGVPLTGGNLEGLQAEFGEIYSVFCAARESVMVFYSGSQPSYIYRRLAQLAGFEIEYIPNQSALLTNKKDAALYLAGWDAFDEASFLGLDAEYADACRCRDYTLGDIEPENVKKIYGELLNLSASQVDKQADCRLRYFLQYGLRARERKEATVDPAEYGTYVHWVLEKTGQKVMELGGFHQVSVDQTWQIAKEFSDEYAKEHFAQIDSQRVVYLLERNAQELEMVVRELWEELSVSAFQPVDFEVSFGEGMQMPPIGIPASYPAQLRGFVDRVDAWQEDGRNYFRVVDYKTGRKDFDYCDVFNGSGLQMLLYMFALEQGGEGVLGDAPVSAGVQYFSARSPLLTTDGRVTEEQARQLRSKEWKRKGLILSDEDVLQAMEPEGSPHRLNCTRRKDGSVSGDIADREQMNMLRRYVFCILRKLVDDIASGNVEPNPYTRGSSHNACSFCPYKPVCNPSTVAGRRNYKTMSAQRFWEEIGKEVGNG
ncbi:MAG: exodeoxyribonuclease V subunit gamma [Oscillospiraceae bacterium]|nr:exodeoxyribonuclease V subunit gamma [Oscillospiraceae bacterium]